MQDWRGFSNSGKETETYGGALSRPSPGATANGFFSAEREGLCHDFGREAAAIPSCDRLATGDCAAPACCFLSAECVAPGAESAAVRAAEAPLSGLLGALALLFLRSTRGDPRTKSSARAVFLFDDGVPWPPRCGLPWADGGETVGATVSASSSLSLLRPACVRNAGGTVSVAPCFFLRLRIDMVQLRLHASLSSAVAWMLTAC